MGNPDLLPVELEPTPAIEAYKSGIDRSLLREKSAPHDRSASREDDRCATASGRDSRFASQEMTDFAALLESLVRHGVEFIVIGGFAATAHGSAFLTVDLDVAYRRTAENIARLAESLAPLKPYLRGAPGGLPFQLDEETIRRGLNFTLTTTAGDVDLLGEAAGGGIYEARAQSARSVSMGSM